MEGVEAAMSNRADRDKAVAHSIHKRLGLSPFAKEKSRLVSFG
jgi:hypothetical protein